MREIKQKLEYIENTYNTVNSIYYKCENCGKILMMAGSKVESINNICACDEPCISDIIYINPKKI
jgi:hypothetical protein